MYRAFTCMLAFAVTLGLAYPLIDDYVLHERRIADGSRGARLEQNAIIPIRIGMKQQNLDKGYDHVMRAADPNSPSYAAHWTREEVDGEFEPHPETFEAVKRWLVNAGINASDVRQSENRGWLAINMPVIQAEALFRAEYHEYEAYDSSLRIGCEEYYLPSHVSKHVDFIKPGVSLSPPLRKRGQGHTHSLFTPDEQSTLAIDFRRNLTTTPDSLDPFDESRVAASKDCETGTTVACIRNLYGIPKTHNGSLDQGLGVYETGGAYSQQDLDQYFNRFTKKVPQGTAPIVRSVNHAEAPVPQIDAQGESVIDLDIALTMTYPEPVTLYQVDRPSAAHSDEEPSTGSTFLSTFLDAIDGAYCTPLDLSSGFDCGIYNLTQVLSVSYTSLELAMSQAEQQRACNEFMKLSLQGHTIVFASGDYGTAGFPQQDSNYNGCVAPDLVPTGPVDGKIFNPSFPSNCPYVLSVGGTKLGPSSTNGSLESVMSYSSGQFSSGGGFSNYFERPRYQEEAVQRYLDGSASSHPSYEYNGFDRFSGRSNIGAKGGVFNRGGRAYPDVSAIGEAFPAFVRGELQHYLGTSIAAPIWASLIALINTERNSVGKRSVGFVHPTLYHHPEAFVDITSGSNKGCGAGGFVAAPGWDPATGLGVPNYPVLRDVFMDLP